VVRPQRGAHAEGRREFFPHVRRLVAAAPPIDGWRVVAFKPKQGTEDRHEHDHRRQ
jgi:hypothetical protein